VDLLLMSRHSRLVDERGPGGGDGCFERRRQSAGKRRKRSALERLRIVEETLAPGASVARVARSHGINANQVFAWRKLHLAGKLVDRAEPASNAAPAIAPGHRQ
jgi:transposase-like protein